MTDERAEVIRMVKSAPWLVAVLEAVRDVAPPDWYVAAGAVRNTVWDILSGRPWPERWPALTVIAADDD
jgi:hypothetical protein